MKYKLIITGLFSICFTLLSSGQDTLQVVLKSYDSSVYKYHNYIITTTRKHTETGDNIQIFSIAKNRNLKFEDAGDEYFYFVYKDFAIFDVGTCASIRGFYVYNFDEEKYIYNHNNYGGDVSQEDDKLYFETPISDSIIHAEKLKLPVCKDCLKGNDNMSCGYVRKIYYDLRLRKEVNTKKIRCAFFE